MSNKNKELKKKNHKEKEDELRSFCMKDLFHLWVDQPNKKSLIVRQWDLKMRGEHTSLINMNGLLIISTQFSVDFKQ